jgi:hypothetical protein
MTFIVIKPGIIESIIGGPGPTEEKNQIKI